jgi:hypothetical protein
MQHVVNLTANTWSKQESRGRLLVLLDQGAAANIAVRIWQNTNLLEEIDTAATGFKARMSDGHFTHFELKPDANCTAKVVVTDNAIDFDWFEGAHVHVITSIGDPLYVSPVDPPAVAITDNAAVAVGGAAAQLIVAADANRRQLRFANLGTDPVALGAVGITWAKRVIVVNPGDMWIEDRAANLAWYGITDAGLAASVTTQAISV